MAYSSLTPNEQKQFAERIAIYGLTPKDIEGKTIVTGEGKPGPLVISPSAEYSDVEVVRREVTNVAEMKSLGGVPDVHYTRDGVADHHINYPPTPGVNPQQALATAKGDVCALLEHLGPENATHVGAAMHAYLLGDSSKVKAYEPLINALHFPVTGAIASGDSITVKAGHPLVIKGPGPVALNYAVMTIEPGGQVIVETEVTFNIGKLNSNVS
jgi:hypothetical protein